MTTPNREHDEHDSSHENVFASYEAELANIAKKVKAEQGRGDGARSRGDDEWRGDDVRTQRPRTWSPPDESELDEDAGAAMGNNGGSGVDFSEVDPSLLASPEPRPIAQVAWVVCAFFFCLLLAARVLPSVVEFNVPGWLGPVGAIGMLVSLVAAVVASAPRRGSSTVGDDGARL